MAEVTDTLEGLPRFSGWSPAIVGAASLAALLLPAWVCAVIWVVGLLGALPFGRFRLVVPCALAAFALGWLINWFVLLTAVGSLHRVLPGA
jgi:hypothetical protein